MSTNPAMPGGSPAARKSLVHWIPAALVVGAFTPYLGLGLNVRWEHLLAYGILASGVANGRLLASRSLPATRSLLVPWAVLACLVLVSAASAPVIGNTLQQATRLLGILDSFLLPISLLLTSACYAARDQVAWMMQVRRTSGTFLILVCLNSALILYFPLDQVPEFVRYFWANPATVGARGTVAEQAIGGARYSGIINQPLEGGLVYSLAIMCWAYMYVITPKESKRRWIDSFVTLGLVVVGGLSTGSKVFIFGSILVLLLTIVPSVGSRGSRRLRLARAAAVVPLGIYIVAASGTVTFNRFLGVLGAVGNDSAAVSGGRWNSLGDYVQQLLSNVSVLGLGWQGPQDDALLAYLQGGGVFGVIAFGFIIRALFGFTTRVPRRSGESAMLRGMTVLVVASSFSAISLQINRASSIYWIFLGLFVGYHRRRPRSYTAAPSMVYGS
jgi:hypothetical protein